MIAPIQMTLLPLSVMMLMMRRAVSGLLMLRRRLREERRVAQEEDGRHIFLTNADYSLSPRAELSESERFWKTKER